MSAKKNNEMFNKVGLLKILFHEKNLNTEAEKYNQVTEMLQKQSVNNYYYYYSPLLVTYNNHIIT